MIEFSLIEIEKPLGMIPETPSVTPPTINYYELDNYESEEEGSNSYRSGSISEDMEDNNDNNGEGGYQTQYNQPWFERYSLVILGWMHNLPKHPEKLLPKFDPKTSRLLEDHIKKFILAIRLMNVQQKDVVC
jgi:hypothetical protein